MDNKEGTYIGRTYSTKIDVPIDALLEISFVDVSEYIDPDTGKVFFNYWAPHVIREVKDKKTTSINELHRHVLETTNRVQKRRYPKRGMPYKPETRRGYPTGKSKKASELSLDQSNPYMRLVDERKRWNGMVHAHVRGRSVHLDFRFQNSEVAEKELAGFTILIPKGLPRGPKDFEDAKQLVDKEIIPLVKETLSDPSKKFDCVEKQPEPIEWMTYEGEVKEGSIGATRFEKGWFYIIDKFEIEYGTQKVLFHEYFPHGKLFNGRLIFREIENKKEWKKTPEGLMTWFMFRSKREDPYAISKRALEKKWHPPKGVSALPRSVRKKIPKKFRYWESDRPTVVRDELINQILLKKIQFSDSEDEEVSGEEDENTKIIEDRKKSKLGLVNYKLQRQIWKGQFVIRYGPSRTLWLIIFKSGNTFLEFAMDRFPPSQGILQKSSQTRWNISGAIQPKTKFNPTKNTPSWIFVEETGKCRLEKANQREYKIKFPKGKLEGNWRLIKEEGPANVWTLVKS